MFKHEEPLFFVGRAEREAGLQVVPYSTHGPSIPPCTTTDDIRCILKKGHKCEKDKAVCKEMYMYMHAHYMHVHAC